MKESLKEIFLMGVGAISMTGEKASELKKELLKKGQEAYEEGTIKNEELKREIKDKIKENTNIEYTTVTDVNEDNIVDVINSLDDEEKAKILEMLNEKKEEKKPEEKKTIKID